jgi:anti-sigma-K factor RskA
MAVEDIHSLAPAYALDGLDPDEERRFEAHLAACEQCRADVDSFRESVTALAFAAGPADPPADLRERILEQARAERPHVVPLRPRRLFGQASWSVAVAAVAACAAIGVGIWAASLSRSLHSERQAASHREAALSVLADPAATKVPLSGQAGAVAVDPSGTAALVVSGLGHAPNGKTYEIWVIEGQQPKRAGLFDGGGASAVKLDRRVPKGSVVAVTLERDGGVDSPSGKPLFFAKIA